MQCGDKSPKKIIDGISDHYQNQNVKYLIFAIKKLY